MLIHVDAIFNDINHHKSFVFVVASVFFLHRSLKPLRIPRRQSYKLNWMEMETNRFAAEITPSEQQTSFQKLALKVLDFLDVCVLDPPNSSFSIGAHVKKRRSYKVNVPNLQADLSFVLDLLHELHFL